MKAAQLPADSEGVPLQHWSGETPNPDQPGGSQYPGQPGGSQYPGQPGGSQYPGQPGGSQTVQYTAVNIISDPPRDYIIWSLFCFCYSNICCLGLAALIFSIKSRDRKVVGDLQGAQHYGATARCLNIVATVLVSLLILCAIITAIVVAVKIQQAIQPMNIPTYPKNYNPPSWRFRH